VVQAARIPTTNGLSRAPSTTDPLDRVLELGSRAVRTGLIGGLIAALLVHGAGAAKAISSPMEIQSWVRETRRSIHEYLWRTYDVEDIKPATPPPEPPPEEQKEEPRAPAPAAPRVAKSEPEHKEIAPAAAQAGKVLTQEPSPDEPVDLTGQGFVSGTAESYAGGVTAANGTSTTAVRQMTARPDGIAGGKGTAPAPPGPAAEGPDRSRPAEVAGGLSWNCPFPPEADADQIDFQVVTIVVTVRPDGTPQSVKVLQDPGHGFGRAARQCALGQRFSSAFDRSGSAILATTAPIRVRFTR
jgi:protein TonB